LTFLCSYALRYSNPSLLSSCRIITSSISTSYDVELPSDYESYQSNTSFIQFDIAGVLYCMIASFDFTYYHNIVLQASLPFVFGFLALSALTIRLSMIQTHFDAKRRADRKGELLDKINTQEMAAKTNAQETIISGASQALVLIHPTVTMTMIKLFSCTPILGYKVCVCVRGCVHATLRGVGAHRSGEGGKQRRAGRREAISRASIVHVEQMRRGPLMLRELCSREARETSATSMLRRCCKHARRCCKHVWAADVIFISFLEL